jgi:TonB family protein
VNISFGDRIASGSAFPARRRSMLLMVGRRSFAARVLLTFGIAASAWLGAGGQPAPASGTHTVYLRGPGDPDCAGELERARARGEPAGLFLAEVKCRVHPGWKCPANCKGDELLVTHLAFKVQHSGQIVDSQVVRNSESRDFDDMSLKAVKAAAPFPAPPAPLADTSGMATLKMELVCDCAERPRPQK